MQVVDIFVFMFNVDEVLCIKHEILLKSCLEFNLSAVT